MLRGGAEGNPGLGPGFELGGFGAIISGESARLVDANALRDCERMWREENRTLARKLLRDIADRETEENLAEQRKESQQKKAEMKKAKAKK